MAARVKKLTPKAELIALAKSMGVDNNYLFTSTLERYENQMCIIQELKKRIDEDDTIVSKEYVKGRENIYVHPAITEMNKTIDSANKTATTLTSIISALNENKATKSSGNALLDALDAI